MPTRPTNHRQSLTVLDAFICAIIILLARLCSFDGNDFSKSALNTSWLRCVSILDYFKPRVESVKRAMKMLNCLDLHITQLIRGGKFWSLPISII